MTARNTGSTVIGPSPIARGFGLGVRHTPWKSEELFETPASPNLPGHRFKLRHQLSHLARHKILFPVRVVELWNKLPPELVDTASNETFKLRLDGAWDALFVP